MLAINRGWKRSEFCRDQIHLASQLGVGKFREASWMRGDRIWIADRTFFRLVILGLAGGLSGVTEYKAIFVLLDYLT